MLHSKTFMLSITKVWNHLDHVSNKAIMSSSLIVHRNDGVGSVLTDLLSTKCQMSVPNHDVIEMNDRAVSSWNYVMWYSEYSKIQIFAPVISNYQSIWNGMPA